MTARPWICATLLALGMGVAQAASPTHLYALDNSLLDSLGGPALSSFGGTLGATHYSFDANQGLAVDNAVDPDVYTIDIRFVFASTSGYRRIIDFQGGDSDTGLYILNTALNFYPGITGPDSVVVDGQPVRVTITRDEADNFTGYVDGVQQISFLDDTGLARFGTASNTARFFIDDNVVAGEASAGSVDSIAIYATALSAQEIAALAPAVPEPGTYALMLVGLAGVLALGKHRRQRA